jgi:pimeloyl-ACP methyl ester carboxylesterase
MRSTQQAEPSPPTRQGFARSDDGLQLFWRVVGEGEPALVCCNGIGVSTFFWEYLIERFSRDRAVVLWDYRGHGSSSVVGPAQRVDMDQLARDLGAVIRELGLERPVLFGHSMGTQVILERYRQEPASVGGLVSVLGTPGYPLDTFNDLRFSRQGFDVALQLFEWFPRMMDLVGKLIVAMPGAFDLAGVLKMVDGGQLSRHDLRQYLHHLTAVGFPFFFRMAKQMGEHSARDILSSVACPALIIAAEYDSFTPPRLAREMADRIEDSRLVWLKGASHAGIVEQPETINAAVETFLSEKILPRR